MRDGFTILLWLVPAAMFAAGAALAWVGLRGRRIDDHPICRACGFDLVGSLHSSVCPECGTEVTTKSIRLGHRARRRRPLAYGTLLALPATILLVGLGVATARGIDLDPYKPLWCLAREGDARALTELLRRQGGGELTDQQVQSTVARALAVQADHDRPWQPEWGEFVQRARVLQQVSDDDWNRYARQAVVVELQVRPRVRRGDPVPLRIAYRPPRIGFKPAFFFDIRLTELSLAGVRLPGFGPASIRSGHIVHADVGGPGTLPEPAVNLPAALTERLPDGPQRVSGRIVVASVERVNSTPRTRFAGVGVVTVGAELTLVPADTSTVRLLDDPGLRPKVESAVTVYMPQPSWQQGRVSLARRSIDIHVHADAPPVALAFAVLLRDRNGREWPVGDVTFPARARQAWVVTGRDVPALDMNRVQVVLRGSERAAAATVDLTETWGGELVIPSVLEGRRAAISQPPPPPRTKEARR